MTFKTLFSMAALSLGLAASTAQAQWFPNMGLGILQPAATSNCNTGYCPPTTTRYQPAAYSPNYGTNYGTNYGNSYNTRPISYGTPVNYSPVSYRNGNGVYGNCPGGVCPPANCANGQCFPTNSGNYGQPVYAPASYNRPVQYQSQYQTPASNYYPSQPGYYGNDRNRSYPSANNNYRPSASNISSPFYP